MENLLGNIDSGNKQYGSVEVYYDDLNKQFLLVSTSKCEHFVLSKEEMVKLYNDLERIVNYIK